MTKRTKQQPYPTTSDASLYEDDTEDDTEDLAEVRERCIGVSLDESGGERYGSGRMRRRAVEEPEDFGGLPTEAPPGYARS
jgi:hypothetical protein